MGNLFGVTLWGDGNGSICGNGCGTAFELSPPVGGTGAWTPKTIYRFPGATAASNPVGVTYVNGVLYGAASDYKTSGMQPGTLFALTPSSKKFWNISVDSLIADVGITPTAPLITDPPVSGATTFYGAAFQGGSNGYGTVFSWTP
jgi:hypothetical protein